MKILKQFSQMKEHAIGQCCVVCLMSHGEEGSLTVQDGRKVIYLDIFLELFDCCLRRFIMIMSLIYLAMLIVLI